MDTGTPESSSSFYQGGKIDRIEAVPMKKISAKSQFLATMTHCLRTTWNRIEFEYSKLLTLGNHIQSCRNFQLFILNYKQELFHR